MGPLDRIAERANQRPYFFGWWLARYARGEELDEAGLAEALGCGPEQLPKLRLCRAPRPDTFREDVTRICELAGLEPARVAEVARRAAVLVKLEAPQGADEAAPTLMAARDLDEGGP